MEKLKVAFCPFFEKNKSEELSGRTPARLKSDRAAGTKASIPEDTGGRPANVCIMEGFKPNHRRAAGKCVIFEAAWLHTTKSPSACTAKQVMGFAKNPRTGSGKGWTGHTILLFLSVLLITTCQLPRNHTTRSNTLVGLGEFCSELRQ